MILVTGGSFQGKRAFAEQYLMEEKKILSVSWTDGGTASWEEFMEAGYCCNFHLFVRRALEGQAGPGNRNDIREEEEIRGKEGIREEEEFRGKEEIRGKEGIRNEAHNRVGDHTADVSSPGLLTEALGAGLLAGPSDRVLVTDDIGCGIVPADAFQRMYREETGRLCCLMAKEAKEVWRVCCGTGMRIK